MHKPLPCYPLGLRDTIRTVVETRLNHANKMGHHYHHGSSADNKGRLGQSSLSVRQLSSPASSFALAETFLWAQSIISVDFRYSFMK